jgi:hypothetical protein
MEPVRSTTAEDPAQSVAQDLAQDVADDLAELQFSPIAPEEAAELDDRVYLLGVRREYMNIR